MIYSSRDFFRFITTGFLLLAPALGAQEGSRDPSDSRKRSNDDKGWGGYRSPRSRKRQKSSFDETVEAVEEAESAERSDLLLNQIDDRPHSVHDYDSALQYLRFMLQTPKDGLGKFKTIRDGFGLKYAFSKFKNDGDAKAKLEADKKRFLEKMEYIVTQEKGLRQEFGCGELDEKAHETIANFLFYSGTHDIPRDILMYYLCQESESKDDADPQWFNNVTDAYFRNFKNLSMEGLKEHAHERYEKHKGNQSKITKLPLVIGELSKKMIPILNGQGNHHVLTTYEKARIAEISERIRDSQEVLQKLKHHNQLWRKTVQENGPYWESVEEQGYSSDNWSIYHAIKAVFEKVYLPEDARKYETLLARLAKCIYEGNAHLYEGMSAEAAEAWVLKEIFAVFMAEGGLRNCKAGGWFSKKAWTGNTVAVQQENVWKLFKGGVIGGLDSFNRDADGVATWKTSGLPQYFQSEDAAEKYMRKVFDLVRTSPFSKEHGAYFPKKKSRAPEVKYEE